MKERVGSMQNKVVIAVTGGVASGKSVACDYLRDCGYPVISADDASRVVIQRLDIIRQIVKIFGANMINDQGEVIRKKLGAVVFSDPEKLSQLNQLMISPIMEEIQKRTEFLFGIVFVEVPLLFEHHLQEYFSESLLICTDSNAQIQRMIHRDHVSVKYAESVVKAQMSLDEKKKLANHIIINNQDTGHLHAKLDQYLLELKKRVI